MIFQVISGSSKRSSRKGMENLKVSCFLILAVTALFVADAAVVKTNTGINRIKVIELEDSPKAPADIYEENTGDVRPIERQQTQTPTSDETKKAYGDAIALFNFKAESPQLYFQAIEEVPLDATDILFWNEDVSESPQIPALLSKEAAVLDNGFFGDSEYYTVLAGLQNPLQIDDKVHGENGGLLDWGETLPKSQGALSQEHGQDALVGNTEDRKPPVLKCRKSEGDHVVTVTCKGSCFVWQAQETQMDLKRVKNEDKLELCRKYYLGGFAFLPFLWIVNSFWFFEEAFIKPHYEQQRQIKTYVIRSIIGSILWIAVIVTWVTIFQLKRAEWGATADYMSFIIPRGEK